VDHTLGTQVRSADGVGGRSDATEISVIVPFRAAAPYIERCIEALLSQSYARDRYELIMVDNNSADGSADIARRYSRVKLLSEGRRGAYVARNRGLAEATGALIAFTDADCAPAATWLETMAATLEDRRVGVALGRVVSPPSRLLALLSAYEHERARYIFDGQAQHLYYGYTNNMVVRRTLLDSVGPFAEVERGADVVFVRRVAETLSPAAVRYAPDAVVEHLEMTGALTWLRKMFIYGRTSRYYRAAPGPRMLTRSERIELFRRTIRSERCSLSDRARLFTALGLGVGLHLVGRWSAVEAPRA
jgi:glycosyltransferase involved in cell wall biosynthesis